MNDRVLRNITVGLGRKVDGVTREDHFIITVASEIMAILCLSKDILDLKETKDMYLEKHGDKHLLIMDSLKDYLFIQLPVCFIILL